MTKITIAIAVYNVEKYIERCIDSVLNQDFSDYEALVVDDRGKDNSINLIEKMAQSHPNGEKIRIFHHEKNLGTGAVRNTSIDEARGEYIFFMDGDDYLAPNAIRLLYEAMTANNADVVIGNHQSVFPDGRIEYTTNYKQGCCISEYAIIQWMRKNEINHYPVATWNKLFKISFLRDNGIRCVPWHRHEDIFFGFQTAFFVKSIATVPEITYYWAQLQDSYTHQDFTEWHLNQYLDIFDRSMNLIIEKEKSGKLPKELYWILTNKFLYGFVSRNIWNSSLLSNKQKNDYLKHIREITTHIKWKDECHWWKQKLFYMVIKMPYPYYVIKFLGNFITI